MRSALVNTVYVLADGLGFNRLLRARSSCDIAVLMYHGLVPDEASIDAWTMIRESEFRWQMQYLKTHCDVLSVEDLVSRGFDGMWAGEVTRRRKVLITFDDGYRSNYLYAYPILRDFELPATIFLATGFVDTANVFWYDKIIHALQASRCRSVDLRKVGLPAFDISSDTPERRWADIQTVLTAVKVHDAAARETLAEQVDRQCAAPREGMELFRALTGEDIVAMRGDPLISFGSHTHGHEILTQLTGTQARATIERSLMILHELLGEECGLFSYPNGDFNVQLIALLKTLGIRYSFTTEKGFWNSASNPRAVPRIGVGSYDSRAKFAALVSGLFLLK